MNRKLWLLLVASIVILVLLDALGSKNYLLLSFVLLFVTMGVYFWKFEKSGKNSREVVFIAIICALAVAGRVVLAAFSSMKPELFILILGALVSGPETGFLMGTIIALASNMYFGQGAWTPWQMFSLGIVGIISGLMANKKVSIWVITAWGFVSGFLYGWIMDIYFILGFVKPITPKSSIAALVASFPFDVTHAIFTAVLLLLLGKAWMKIFQRYRAKYDLFNNQQE
ncbi:ECF transporter S component [Companilactobacillus ginsenosidimutans]|uniref:Membrane protein n=1 Tax=Companilactobacillus ginsenosidimutans TaxID=1007676 RepID=A0A0H4QXI7_9LACO|nr:ECF transporter S component [Companilactobacillus ginsenosidimutans]AKP66200.1 membrane protein [Companilactobacillus ginsenosidimutans]